MLRLNVYTVVKLGVKHIPLIRNDLKYCKCILKNYPTFLKETKVKTLLLILFSILKNKVLP